MNATMVASESKAVPLVVSSIQDLPLERIRESKTNPRSQFDQPKLAELAENIRQHGVLHPILVRPPPEVTAWSLEYLTYKVCNSIVCARPPPVLLISQLSLRSGAGSDPNCDSRAQLARRFSIGMRIMVTVL